MFTLYTERTWVNAWIDYIAALIYFRLRGQEQQAPSQWSQIIQQQSSPVTTIITTTITTTGTTTSITISHPSFQYQNHTDETS